MIIPLGLRNSRQFLDLLLMKYNDNYSLISKPVVIGYFGYVNLLHPLRSIWTYFTKYYFLAMSTYPEKH